MSEIIRNLMRRRLRSALTVFGICVGILALVLLGSISEMINRSISLGTQYLTGQITVTGGGMGHESGMLSKTQIEKIKAVPGVSGVQGQVSVPLAENGKGGEGGFMSFADTVMGLGIDFSVTELNRNFTLPLTSGRWIKSGERGVVVLGADVAFRKKVDVGDPVSFAGKRFEVVGVLERTLSVPDGMAIFAIDDARELLLESNPFLKEVAKQAEMLRAFMGFSGLSKGLGTAIGGGGSLTLDFDPRELTTQVAVGWKDGTDPDKLAEAIKKAVPGTTVLAPSKMKEQMEQGLVIFNLIIFGTALIALVVGALSVINTMITAISERTAEIGLKKALGAETRDIVVEYLKEAATIGLAGGLLGVLLGAALVFFLNWKTASTGIQIFLLTPRLAIGAILFAGFLGVVAGIYPALRAARLQPVDALRED